MKKLITLGFSIVLAGMLSGCMVRETPYTYGTPVVAAQTANGYPLYYTDGVYWAYQDANWYWWANDHWTMSTYAPHGAVLVDSHFGSHAPAYHGGVTHGSSHGFSSGSHRGSHHGGSHHGGSRHGGGHH